MNTDTQESGTSAAPDWIRNKERGNYFWLRLMCWLSLTLGRRLSRTVVYGIALYFLLTAPAARKASRAYLERSLGRSVSWFDLYRHILVFACTIHDRFYLLNERHDLFDIRMFGVEPRHALAGRKGGLFLFGAHLGSFELMRSIARDQAGLKVWMAMYPENARRINSTLAAINPQAMQNIIPLGQVDAMLAIHQRLAEFAVVGILADRAARPDRCITLPFLGAPARFPTGPFRMAALLRYPVYFMVGLYRGGNRYDVHFELLADFSDATAKRDALVHEVLAKYVATLERCCRSAPYNWFNFYDFWEQDVTPR